MATLDFVVSLPSARELNALPIAARTVTLHVPDSLDPYHQQQLRDALEGELHRGSDALAISVAAMASATSEGSDRLLDDFAAGMAKLRTNHHSQFNRPHR
jgi:hypothetical protein